MKSHVSSKISIAALRPLFLIASVLLITQIISCNTTEPICISPGIVPGQPPYESPIWHPSGKFIGFNHKPIKEVIMGESSPGCRSLPSNYIYREDSVGFWLIDIDGTNKRRILPYTLQTPTWSPDGGWIAFVRGPQIFKMPFDGKKFDTTHLEQLTFDGRNFFPAWSADGKWIAFDSNKESESGLKFIWKMRNNGASKVRLAFTPQQGETRMPAWGTDFSIVHMRYTGMGNGSPEVFTMDSAGNAAMRLTNNLLFEAFPKFSVENKIGFVRYTQDGHRLGVMNADGTNVTLFNQAWISNFDWSPDGKKIVFQKSTYLLLDKNEGTLWIMDSGGTNQKQLTFNSFTIIP